MENILHLRGTANENGMEKMSEPSFALEGIELEAARPGQVLTLEGFKAFGLEPETILSQMGELVADSHPVFVPDCCNPARRMDQEHVRRHRAAQLPLSAGEMEGRLLCGPEPDEGVSIAIARRAPVDEVVSIQPLLRVDGGSIFKVDIEGIALRADRLTATVYGFVEDCGPIAFNDPFFAVNRALYAAGRQMTFIFKGLALDYAPATPLEPIRVPPSAPSYEVQRGFGYPVAEDGSLIVEVADPTIYGQGSDDPACLLNLRQRVVSVTRRRRKLLGQGFADVKLAVSSAFCREPWELTVTLTDLVRGDAPLPRPGEMVGMTVAMQGSLWGLSALDE